MIKLTIKTADGVFEERYPDVVSAASALALVPTGHDGLEYATIIDDSYIVGDITTYIGGGTTAVSTPTPVPSAPATVTAPAPATAPVGVGRTGVLPPLESETKQDQDEDLEGWED